jgi:hypothetical protein
LNGLFSWPGPLEEAGREQLESPAWSSVAAGRACDDAPFHQPFWIIKMPAVSGSGVASRQKSHPESRARRRPAENEDGQLICFWVLKILAKLYGEFFGFSLERGYYLLVQLRLHFHN